MARCVLCLHKCWVSNQRRGISGIMGCKDRCLVQQILKAEFGKQIRDVLENGYKAFINSVKCALS